MTTGASSSSTNLSMELIFKNFETFSKLAQNEQFPEECERLFSIIDSIYEQYCNPSTTPKASAYQNLLAITNRGQAISSMSQVEDLRTLSPTQMLKIQAYTNIVSNICTLATENLK